MAKKKSKKKAQPQVSPSPARFMREKARKLPLGKCYVNSDWREAGMADVAVIRVRPSGNIVMGLFLVDTFCLGVKAALYRTNMTDYEFDDFLQQYGSRFDIEEISYEEAHNIIYGAISFAEEAGIEPCKDFDTASYILEEDTEDVPLIEYEFGRDGKHFLIVGPNGIERMYIPMLQERLGDNFDFLFEFDPDDEYDDEYDDDDYGNNSSEEEYTYQYPEYPQTLEVKHKFIADELFSENNMAVLPREEMERILALPHDEVAEDLRRIVMYEIGRTYRDINADKLVESENDSILHSLLLFMALGTPAGVEPILEIMRQSEAFMDVQLGDVLTPMIVHQALYACGKDNVDAIVAYLYEPGLWWFFRYEAIVAFAMIAYNEPARREEILEVFRRLLNMMTENLPARRCCDGTYAGLVVSALMDINAVELLPEIKTMFDTGYVDCGAAGNYAVVEREMGTPNVYVAETLKPASIFKIYEELDRMRRDWREQQSQH